MLTRKPTRQELIFKIKFEEQLDELLAIPPTALELREEEFYQWEDFYFDTSGYDHTRLLESLSNDIAQNI